MNANFGGYSPAQYAVRDNTFSNIGNRFADVAANAPSLYRQGEQWQDERNARDANERLKQHTFGQIQKLNERLAGQGGTVFNIRPPEKGENVESYVKYVGGVIENGLARDPQLYNLVMTVAPELNPQNAGQVESAMMDARNPSETNRFAPQSRPPAMPQGMGMTMPHTTAGPETFEQWRMQAEQDPNRLAEVQAQARDPRENPWWEDAMRMNVSPTPTDTRFPAEPQTPMAGVPPSQPNPQLAMTAENQAAPGRTGNYAASPELREYYGRTIERIRSNIEEVDGQIAALEQGGIYGGNKYGELTKRRDTLHKELTGYMEKNEARVSQKELSELDIREREAKIKADLARAGKDERWRNPVKGGSGKKPREEKVMFAQERKEIEAIRAGLYADNKTPDPRALKDLDGRVRYLDTAERIYHARKDTEAPYTESKAKAVASITVAAESALKGLIKDTVPLGKNGRILLDKNKKIAHSGAGLTGAEFYGRIQHSNKFKALRPEVKQVIVDGLANGGPLELMNNLEALTGSNPTGAIEDWADANARKWK